MTADRELAQRIRALLGDEPSTDERRMFGGLVFMVHGNLAVALRGRGGLLVRVDPDEAARLVAAGRAAEAVMGRRTMRGWVEVAPEQLRTTRQLAPWVARGVARVRALAGAPPP